MRCFDICSQSVAVVLASLFVGLGWSGWCPAETWLGATCRFMNGVFFEKGRHLVKTGPELFLTTRHLVETGNGLVQNFSGQDCGRPEKFVRLFPERVQRRCASSLYREKGDTKSPGKQQELICRGFNVFFGY